VLLLAPVTLLVVDGLLVGEVRGSAWVKPQKAPLGKVRFWEVGVGRVGRSIGPLSLAREDVPAGIFVSGRSEPSGEVMVSGRRPTVPRPVRTAVANATYRNVVAEWLAKNGKGLVASDVRVAFADLNGDGSQEVILTAGNLPNRQSLMESKSTDYSLVLLRHLRNGVAQERSLSFSRGGKNRLLYWNRLRAIADLNGDGSMEIVVSSDYYEGQSASVWSLRRGREAKLVENGAGV